MKWVSTLEPLALMDAEYTQHPFYGSRKITVYQYLLRGVNVIRPNQVLSTDITYIRLARGFVYVVAVIDWYSLKRCRDGYLTHLIV